MRYRILGPLEVLRNGEPVPLGVYKQRALLALLLLNANQVVSTDRIIDEIWGDGAGSGGRNALWVNISGLRSALEPDREKRSEGTVVLTRSPGYLLAVEGDDIDAVRFEHMAREGRMLLDADPVGAADVLGEALGMWRGHPLEDFAYEAFAQADIARLAELRLGVVEDRIEANLRSGRSRELIGELEGLVRQHPLRERLTGHLMLALHRSGRTADALRAFGALKTRLGEELGIEPSPAVAELEERIVLDDPRLRRPSVRGVHDDGAPGLSVRGYELRRKIGEGRHGRVYEAFQPSVGRTVAVKVIRPKFANDAAFIRRFEAEAQVVAGLEHPNVVPLFDYWREPDAAYLVTGLFTAGSLEDVLAQGPLPSERAVRVIHQIGGALAAAHRRQVIHGDLKPSNIVFDAEQNALVLDFGLVGAGALTAAGQANRAPELAAGGPVTVGADVYSLARIAERTLAGATGNGGGPESPLVGPVAAVIGRACADDPESRPADVATFLAELDQALGNIGERTAPPETDVPNPYKGLRAFDERDADHFFGRERLIERLVARLGRPGLQGRFAALVGPSGAGKSSVVRAGLIPAVRAGALPGSDDWFVVTMTPGRHPIEALETALMTIAVNPPPSVFERLIADGIGPTFAALSPAPSARLLLVVDQLEELFSHATRADADAFLSTLAEAATDPQARVTTVVTLRADFYDHPLRHAAFGELLRLGTEVITPMTAAELERAIAGPASLVGVSYEPALVAQVVSEITGRPSALPLLQYALTELFGHRRDGRITAEAYRELGGVSAALATRADRVNERLSDDASRVVRDVFLRLVALQESGEDTRRRAEVAELEELGQGPVREVLDGFGHHRLLAFDRDPVTRGPTAEIAHEALLTEWTRLRAWIDDARSDVLAQRRLATAAAEWRERGENPDFLLTGARLARFARWTTEPPVRLTAGERQFLTASTDAEAGLEQERERQARRDLTLRRRTLLLGGLAVAALAFVVLAAFAFNERDRASGLADEARQLAAQSGRLAEEAQASADEATRAAATLEVTERALRLSTLSALERDADPQLGLMLAIEAARATAASGEILPTALDGIHWALQASRVQYPSDEGVGAVVRSGPAGPTGVFDLPPNDLIALAQQHVDRGFTAAECARFFAGDACPEPSSPFPPGLEVTRGDRSYDENATGLPGLAGTEVVVTSAFTPGFGAEFVQAALDTIGDRTGIDVRHRFPGRTLAVNDVVRGDDPGDIAILPQPGALAQLARDGYLMDVSAYLDVDVLRAAYAEYLVALSSVGAGGSWPDAAGTTLGVFVNLDVKSLVWYVKAAFEEEGYPIPGSWAELIELSDQMVEDGYTPWCLSIADPDVDAWPASDWVETLILRTAGPDFYDRWVLHEVPFDHPAVEAAVSRIGELAFGPGYVRPSAAAISERLFFDGAFLMAEEPAQCLMMPFANFTPYLDPRLSSGGVIDVFPFPVTNPDHGAAMVGGGNVAVALSDRPEVREVIRAMARPDWGEAWAEAGDGYAFVPANRFFDLSVFPSDTGRFIAEQVQEAVAAGQFRYDGSDSMPVEIGLDAFLQGMSRYFREGPESVGAILADVEAKWSALEEQTS